MSGPATVPRPVLDSWISRARELGGRPFTLLQFAAFGAWMLNELTDLRGGLGFPAPSHDRERLACALAAISALRVTDPDEEAEPVHAATAALYVAEAEVARLKLRRKVTPEAERYDLALAIQGAEAKAKAARTAGLAAEGEAWIARRMEERAACLAADRARILAAGLPLSLDDARARRGGGVPA
jgi:hypothetical protein